MPTDTQRKDILHNAAVVGGGVAVGYALTKALGREDMLTGWGVIGAVGLIGMVIKPDPYSGPFVTGITAALFGGLVTAALEDPKPVPVKKDPVTKGPALVDWEATLAEATKRCMAGDRDGCILAEQARVHLGQDPLKVVVKNRAVDTPQVSLDPARENAIKSCLDGNNEACCYLKNVKNEAPPKPCVETAPGVSGLGWWG